MLQERLDILAHERDQRKDRQQAENHAGDGSQKLHQEGAGVGKLRRRQLGKEDRGAHSQRDGNQERDERRQHRSVDEGQRAELFGDRDPTFFP